jgi:hypothetical protein
MSKGIKHSVLLFNDSSNGLIDSRKRELELLNLPHPKGCGVLFAHVGTDLYELQSAEARRFGSWFIDQRVSSDPHFYVANKIDPRFLVLPYFEKEAGAKFSPLDQVMMIGDGYDRMPLKEAATRWKLDEMLDMKDLGDDLILFRFNKEKVLALLKAKVESAAKAICVHRKKQSKADTSVSTFDVSAQEALNVGGTGSQGNTTQDSASSSELEVTADDKLEAMQLVSDYLTDNMTKNLASAMDLNLSDVNTVSMKGEKRKADWEIELEIEKETLAYTAKPVVTSQNDAVQSNFGGGFGAPNSGMKPPAKKAMNAAARIGKPKGTASIASFFGAKK